MDSTQRLRVCWEPTRCVCRQSYGAAAMLIFYELLGSNTYSSMLIRVNWIDTRCYGPLTRRF